LQFFSHPEGYVHVENGNYEYVYNYLDHLGNVRLSYTDSNGDGDITSNEIIEENNYYPFGLEHKGYNNVVNGTENKYKTYNGKELEEELGKNTLAYGWRDYDPAIGRFNKVDRFSEKYYSLSTYSYAGNNPILFVDVQGDSIAAGSQKRYDKLKNKVTKTRDKLQRKADKINVKAQKKGWSADKTSKKLGNIQERVASLDGTLNNFGTLESSTQVYELKSGQTEGGLTYDTSSGNIVIGYGNTANFVHEATHAAQFESGDIAFSTTNGASLLQDLGDEVAAYKAQFAFSPSSVSGLSGTTKASSFAGITGTWVQGLNDAGGNKLYAPGGSANTGIVPININSTRADLMRAYPGNTAISSQPANLNLQTQPTIYFKRQ